MIINFKEHAELKEYQQLDEKLIMYNNGAKYGQVVFLAGGAGSGKGFAQQNFMEVDKFKVFDVDELKKALIKMKELKMDLRKPQDVFDLHMLVKKGEYKNKILSTLFQSLKVSQAGTRGVLPNLMFDITLKEMADINEVLPMLLVLGYKPKDIHITWVLTNYYVAVQANQERERVVPDDILLQTHIGASKTMSKLIQGNIPAGVDGGVYVILNTRENTIPWVRKVSDKKTTSVKDKGEKKKLVVKDFTYLTLRKPGKKFESDSAVKRQVFDWIQDNVPKDALKQIDIPKQ